jgi:hypothetical protein
VHLANDSVQYKGEASCIWDLRPLVGLLKVMGCSNQGRYLGLAMVLMPLTAKTHQEVSFLSHLFSEAARPPKIIWTVLLGS